MYTLWDKYLIAYYALFYVNSIGPFINVSDCEILCRQYNVAQIAIYCIRLMCNSFFSQYIHAHIDKNMRLMMTLGFFAL